MLGLGRDGAQPGLGGDGERDPVPRKGWSPHRDTQMLGWGNLGRKTIFAAAV